MKSNIVILGAGASVHLGYPTGAGLIANLQKWAKRRVLYQNLEIGLVPTSSLKTSHYFIGDAIDFKKVGNNKDFFDALKVLTTYENIDSFLRDNKKYRHLGGQLIAATILGCEKRGPANGFGWYNKLMSRLLKCNSLEEILNLDLSIITFNYDVSLEYFIYQQLSNIEKYKNHADVICEYLKDRIIHIYGSVRTGSFKKIYEGYGHIYDSNEKTILDTALVNYASQTKLEVIYDEKINDKFSDRARKARELITNANNLYILGFGFDEGNVNLLGLQDIRKDQQVYYANYENISRIRKKIEGLDIQNVRCSPSTVCEAFDKDFEF